MAPTRRPKSSKMSTKKRVYKRARRLTLEKRIKAIAYRTQETKELSAVVTRWTDGGNVYDNQTIYGLGMALPPTAGNVYRGYVIPNFYEKFPMSTGHSQSKRNGNEIHVVNCILKGFVIANPYNDPSNINRYPFEVKMVIYRQKKSTLGNATMIKQSPGGNNVNTAIDGSVPVDLADWNRDEYVIYKTRTWRFRAPTDPVGGNNTIAGSMAAKQFQRFRISLPVPKKLQFADNSTVCSNHWFAIGFYLVFGDGQIKSAAAANVYAVAQMKYKDA